MKLFIATMTAVCALTAAAQATTFTSYYAFGDSLSDNGKIPLGPPYSKNPDLPGHRFSSGPTWAEFIAKRFTDRGFHTENLALGGATATDINFRSDGIGTVPDEEYPDILQPLAHMARQVQTFAGIATSLLPQDNPLVSVFMGGNDFLQGGDATDAANAVADGIEAIKGYGTKFNNFLVSNLPELGDPVAGGTTFAMTFNTVLADRLDDLINIEGYNIIKIDQAAFQADLFPRLGDLGINPFLPPCLDADAGTDCTVIGQEANGDLIRDLSLADQRYLIDSVHPSGPVQREFGAFALATLGSAVPPAVPLPGGLPLALAGIAVFGVMRARR